MLDILLLVDNKESFHKDNININPNHYSYIGSRFYNSFLILYNSHVKFGEYMPNLAHW
jgi:Phosphatidate cytidylyltransferase, mitochondrial